MSQTNSFTHSNQKEHIYHAFSFLNHLVKLKSVLDIYQEQLEKKSLPNKRSHHSSDKIFADLAKVIKSLPSKQK